MSYYRNHEVEIVMMQINHVFKKKGSTGQTTNNEKNSIQQQFPMCHRLIRRSSNLVEHRAPMISNGNDF